MESVKLDTEVRNATLHLSQVHAIRNNWIIFRKHIL
jgi:hypothetical protein